MIDTDRADAADWQAYSGHRIDELEANWRANGPRATEPELRALFSALERIAPPGAELAPLGLAVFAAIRDAERDARAAGERRVRAYEDLERLQETLREARDIARKADLPGIAALLDYREEGRAATKLRTAHDWLGGWYFGNMGVAMARKALRDQGNTPKPVRRLAERLATLFEEVAGKPPKVTRRTDGTPDSGKFVELLAAAADLAGIRAQPSEVGNAARKTVEAINSKRKQTELRD